MTNKIWGIISAILLAIIVGLFSYAVLVQPKVKAGQEYMDKIDRLNELDRIIEEAKDGYNIALESKQECIISRDEKMLEEHQKAENARKEIEEINFINEQKSSEKNPTTENVVASNLEDVEVVEKVLEAMDEAESIVRGDIMRKKERGENDIRQEYVDYAYKIGGKDLVYLIECENATWNMSRQSEVVKDGKREQSYWFCQISKPHHPEIVNNDKFWNDWKRQLDRCKELMRNGTPFYWRDRKIKGVKCSDYVKDRFEILVNEN